MGNEIAITSLKLEYQTKVLKDQKKYNPDFDEKLNDSEISVLMKDTNVSSPEELMMSTGLKLQQEQFNITELEEKINKNRKKMREIEFEISDSFLSQRKYDDNFDKIKANLCLGSETTFAGGFALLGLMKIDKFLDGENVINNVLSKIGKGAAIVGGIATAGFLGYHAFNNIFRSKANEESMKNDYRQLYNQLKAENRQLQAEIDRQKQSI